MIVCLLDLAVAFHSLECGLQKYDKYQENRFSYSVQTNQIEWLLRKVGKLSEMSETRHHHPLPVVYLY